MGKVKQFYMDEFERALDSGLDEHDADRYARAAFDRLGEASRFNSSYFEMNLYESGMMSDEDEVEFFQKLINEGSVWDLRGSYQRRALELIELGLCVNEGMSYE